VHAYLIITKSSELAEQKARELIPEARLIPYTIAKIADTRELVRQTGVSFARKTVFFLSNFDKASIEAQNAFLKSLEESQENVVFVLAATHEEAVLPTIVSRCQVVRPRKMPSASRGKVSGHRAISFAEIAKITKREEATEYLENLINALSPKLPEGAITLRYADEALTRIKANANPTLQLTRFLVHV